MYHFSIQSGNDGVDHVQVMEGGRTIVNCHLYDGVPAAALEPVEDEEFEEVLL